jgi:ABC-2 type transport system ATP-binding protein
MSEKQVITFESVDKFFYLHHQKTLKEFAQALFTRKKTMEHVKALTDVSFIISPGESVGIIGRNGAGKSTLLKLIAGVSQPSRGRVYVQGRVSPLIELGAGFHPELTGRENVFLNGVIMGLPEQYLKDKFDEIGDFSEIHDYIDTPVKYYSSGMYMRLAFSVAVHVDPQILLIDEILSVGDAGFRDKCMKKMNDFKKKGVTIIFISHSPDQIQRFCDRVLYLQDGKLAFDGPTEKGIELYLKRLQ